MGTCYETRADRTRFIINEDFKVKQAMLRTFQNYSKIQKEKTPEIGEQIEFNSNANFSPKLNIGIPTKT